jgi:glycosyltransferase involved in cell wall biosynthesis
VRKVRVLAVVSDLHFGGGENRILNIASAIDKTRFDYQVATLYRPDAGMCSRLGDLRAEFRRAGIPVTHLDLPRPRPKSRSRAAQVTSTSAVLATTIWRLRALFELMRPDVIDAHLQPAVLTAIPAALLACIPVALTLYQAEPLGFAHRSLANACIRRASALVTDSYSSAETLATSSGRGWRQVYVVPNGVRLSSPSLPRRDILAALGVRASTRTVVAQIAGLVPSKGYDTLLDAAARFLPHHPDAVLLCVGYAREQTTYVDFLKRRARELCIGDQVRIVSWPGSIADVWSVVDVHVHASHYDSLPNAVIEGMSLGRPAVVTSTGGIPELVSDEQTGLVVEPRNATALADAVSRMLRDEGLRRRLSCAAKRKFEERCAPGVMTQTLEEMFCQLAGSRPPGPVFGRAVQ